MYSVAPKRLHTRWYMMQTPRLVVRCNTAPSEQGHGQKVELNKKAANPITLSDKALNQIQKLGKDKAGDSPVVLRVGVKSGGCSGMSYMMDFETGDQLSGDYVVHEADGAVEIRIDPKSLLYLFGLQLDYDDALIGGGFKFFNPNAQSSCGCGTSFSV